MKRVESPDTEPQGTSLYLLAVLANHNAQVRRHLSAEVAVAHRLALIHRRREHSGL